jgi:hypothetical protein
MHIEAEVTKQVNEIAEVIYLMQLSLVIASQRRADIYKILLKTHEEYSKKINDLTRKLYIAEKAVEDSKL